MSKKEPQIKVFEVLMVDVVLEVLVRVAPFLSFVSILSLRCTNKKLHTVFSRKVVWKALGFPPKEVRDGPSMPWDSGFLMVLNLWDFETEKKKVHLTPWRKGITGVAQGALRWISYTGDMRQGVLKAGCMPSVKWTKRKLVSGDTDNPYILSCSFANGQPGTISCGCPVGCGDGQPSYQRAEVAARGALAPEVFEANWAVGEGWSLDQAIVDAATMTVDGARGREQLTPDAVAAFNLTPREVEVLRLLATGMSDREIGETLFVGTRTVDYHVANLLAKLDLDSRVAATAFAVRHGLG